MSLIEHGGKQYRTVFGSDVRDGRDSMFLELQDPDYGGVLGAYWSDVDGAFTFFTEKVELPFEVVEAFMREARRRLPPDGDRRLSWMKVDDEG